MKNNRIARPDVRSALAKYVSVHRFKSRLQKLFFTRRMYKAIKNLEPIWDKMNSFYPMIGKTLEQKSYNLKNPKEKIGLYILTRTVVPYSLEVNLIKGNLTDKESEDLKNSIDKYQKAIGRRKI